MRWKFAAAAIAGAFLFMVAGTPTAYAAPPADACALVTPAQVSAVLGEAHYMTTPGFPTGLSGKKGNFAFKVRVYGFSLAQVKEKEKILALKALAKL